MHTWLAWNQFSFYTNPSEHSLSTWHQLGSLFLFLSFSLSSFSSFISLIDFVVSNPSFSQHPHTQHPIPFWFGHLVAPTFPLVTKKKNPSPLLLRSNPSRRIGRLIPRLFYFFFQQRQHFPSLGFLYRLLCQSSFQLLFIFPFFQHLFTLWTRKPRQHMAFNTDSNYGIPFWIG